eukprot:scaffold1300_cov317-Prasinococcus_capsulatus_cf.AAC.15
MAPCARRPNQRPPALLYSAVAAARRQHHRSALRDPARSSPVPASPRALRAAALSRGRLARPRACVRSCANNALGPPRGAGLRILPHPAGRGRPLPRDRPPPRVSRSAAGRAFGRARPRGGREGEGRRPGWMDGWMQSDAASARRP